MVELCIHDQSAYMILNGVVLVLIDWMAVTHPKYVWLWADRKPHLGPYVCVCSVAIYMHSKAVSMTEAAYTLSRTDEGTQPGLYSIDSGPF
ncbi:hypothetical protein FB451DRAFT_1318441 [Mycena latifolia]|nr:hypothetical protein FB451DRAFT_1318441 [Mycena latifolia]